jgi:hypothetical protein
MTDIKIECPHCHKSFKLNETLAAPLVEETRRKIAEEYQGKEDALEDRKRVLAQEQKEAEKARRALDKEREAIASQKEQLEDTVAEQVAEQLKAIERDVARKAKEKYDEKLAERDEEKAELEERIKEKDEKLAEARKQETEFRRKQRELDDKIREVDLAAERKAGELVATQLERIQKDAEDAARLPLKERDKTIADLQAKLEDAVRKATQGSMQLQGEVGELDLEDRLRSAFPRDTIEPVPKGQFGGDCLHRVLASGGHLSGTILWESKRTKNWTNGWTDKLKQDQRVAKAELAVIVTQAMPAGVDSFAEVDGVWVSTPGLAIALGSTLRLCLLECSAARRASEGQQDKMAMLYQYMTGPEFRQRVEAIKEAFTTMQADLIAERTVFERQWARRQKQIDRVMTSTVGMWGDLQAIAGATLPEIEGLELKALAGAASSKDEE